MDRLNNCKVRQTYDRSLKIMYVSKRH